MEIAASHHPDFIGCFRIVGPKGSEVRRIQDSTGAFISIQGKGSTHSKNKKKNPKVLEQYYVTFYTLV